jgi:hypothetical protein
LVLKWAGKKALNVVSKTAFGPQLWWELTNCTFDTVEKSGN